MKPNDSVAFNHTDSKTKVHAETVSVIIPCYNQAVFLNEAIESVLHQTYPYFEIVVIDDGSPDNITEIIKEYPQVTLLRQPNAGAAVARNNGMAHSSGAYLIFLDSDDRLLPGALHAGVSLLTQDRQMAFVTGGVKLIDRSGNLLEIPSQPIVEEHHYKTLLQSNYIWTPGVVMYRRSVFKSEKGFDPGAGGSADYELNIRLARKFRVGCHGELVLEYRQHGQNMSSNYAYMLKSGVSVRRAQYPYIKHDADLIKAWRRGMQIVQQDVGEKYLNEIHKKMSQAGRSEVIKDLQCLMKYYPKGMMKFFVQRVKNLLSPRKKKLTG